MKRIWAVLLPVFILAVAFAPDFSQAQSVSPALSANSAQPSLPQATPYAIAVQDGNSRVWRRTIYEKSPSGNVVTNVHSYTELASGLNHLVNGQWVESSEEIDILPNGTAAATNGQHQAYFPGDIYDGQIELVTPDGQHLKSRPVGLSYFDGTNSVLIAELTNSIGVVVGNNQVIYPNAFTDFKADLRYTYTKAGFEQDIILREQPPTPESLGLNPDTARLQVLTEFFDTAEPNVQATHFTSQTGLSLTDEILGFGQMQMVPGRAFLLGDEANDVEAPVNKQWLLLDGRQILVEEVPVDAIAGGLATLPLLTAQSSSSTPHVVSKHLALPPQRLAQSTSKKMLTQSSLPASGFVLDYVTLNTSTNNYTFQGDTTYYISGFVNISGTTTIEGGAVFKYTNTASAGISAGSWVCKTAPYRMAVFTSKDDNSIGENITGSTGNPTNTRATYLAVGALSTSAPLAYMRFAYAGIGLEQTLPASTSQANPIMNCQFLNCVSAIGLGGYPYGIYGSTYAYLGVYNVLFSQCGTGVTNVNISHGDCVELDAENITADQMHALLATWSGDTYASYFSHLKNSLLTLVTNEIFYEDVGSGPGSYAYIPSVASQSLNSSSGVYQTVGAGNYYLADNTYRNAGTNAINSTLLAQLQQKTTYPPYVYTPQPPITYSPFDAQVTRDTETPGPDLGYHYDPIDYAVSGLTVTNVTFTMSPGKVIAAYGTGTSDYGLSIGANCQLICEGSATNLNHIVTYNTVQEQGTNSGWQMAGLISVTDDGAGASFDFRFTDWSVIGPHSVSHLGIYQSNPVNLRDCQFHGGGLYTYFGPTINLTNCLFERVYLSLYPYDANNPSLRNNTFFGGTLDLFPFGTYHSVVQDNLFDHTAIVDNYTPCTYTGYNAYVTNCNRLQPTAGSDLILTNSPAYQTGPLGNYYEPTNSRLIDAGSTTADVVGLYHYTETTNEVQEGGSTVDIGYHYNALDATGQPVETDVISIAFAGGTIFPIIIRPSINVAIDGYNGIYTITRYNADNYYPSNLTVNFNMSGTATNGVDYTLTNDLTGIAVTNFIIIQAGVSFVEFDIYPLTNAFCLSNLTATLTLVASNGDIVDPNAFSTNILIEANPYTYAKDLGPMNPGITYQWSNNFLLTDSVGTGFRAFNSTVDIDSWVSLTASSPVVNMATVKTNAGGFVTDAIYFTGNTPGTIGWVAPDGSNYSNVWATLPGETSLVSGLYVDQTGTFGHNLIAVTGAGDVWEITSSRVATELAVIPGAPLQGVITLTNDSSQWGPWAGKIVTGSGDTNNAVIYAISSSGTVTTNSDLGIVAADFNLISANQNLYFFGTDTGLWKASANLFTNDIGGLLISQPRADGCFGNGCLTLTPIDHMFFMVHWNGTKFVATRSIVYPDYDVFAGANVTTSRMLWQATFAPLDIMPQF